MSTVHAYSATSATGPLTKTTISAVRWDRTTSVRHPLRRNLPLRHPHRARRVGPAALPGGARPRDRRGGDRGRIRGHQAQGGRPGGRRLLRRLLPRVSQLQGRPRAVLHRRRKCRHLQRDRQGRPADARRLQRQHRRRRELRAARPRRARLGRRRAPAVRRHHHVLTAAALECRSRASELRWSGSAGSATWPSNSPPRWAPR